MQKDFHYYATYLAAYTAGYSPDESMEIAYSAQFVDDCTKNYIKAVGGPTAAASSQTQMELVNVNTDVIGLQDIVRIWSSFHFLPRDLYAKPQKKCGKMYKNKYSLIAGPNGELVKKTVELAKGKNLQAVGISMHIISDTWAHQYFAGVPSLVINNMDEYCYEILEDGSERKIKFRHSLSEPDDINNSIYTNSIFQFEENNIMNLGHGRAGHLPDLSYAKYKYMPAWADYEEVIKDNPSDYYHAFGQLVYAMKYLRGEIKEFKLDTYDFEALRAYEDKLKAIFNKRQLDDCMDLKKLGEEISNHAIDDYDMKKYMNEYIHAKGEEKDKSFLGRFFIASLSQKSMVAANIFKSGNLLAGFSVAYDGKRMRGIKDYAKLLIDSGGMRND